ncbi:MAG TPA: regulatory protein RecX [Bacteroidales bacterium]|nr:regulatory protein RecX [Bacteroidales bacterium]
MPDNNLYKTALNKTMALCSRREYCTDDIRNKLRTWELSSEDSEKIIKTLISENFINEVRYANAFVRDKFNYNKWGKVKISVYLRRKKISSKMINTALAGIDEELYKKTLKELITNHRKTTRARNDYELKGKLLRFGLSKGYESHLVYDILGEIE